MSGDNFLNDPFMEPGVSEACDNYELNKKNRKSTESNSPNSSMKYADSLPFSDDITNHGVNAFYDIPSNTNMFRPINRSILNKEILPPINTAQRYYNYFNDPWYILCNYVLKPYQLQKKDPQGTDCRFRRAFVKSLLGIRNEKMINFLMMDDKYLKLIDKIAKKISPYNQALSVILSIYSIYDLVQQKHKNGEKITSKDLFENDTLRQSSIKCFAACMGLLNKIISTMANNDSLRMLKPNKKVCGLVEMASLIFITSKILESRFLEPYIQHYYQNMASSSRRPTQATERLLTEMSTPQDRVSSLYQPVQQAIEILPIEMPTPQDRVSLLYQPTQQATERILTEMLTPQDRVLSLHQATQQAAERLSIEMPMSQDKMLSLRQSIQQATERLLTEMSTPQDRVSLLYQPVQQAIEILPIEMPTPQDRVLPTLPAIQQVTERLLTLRPCSTSNHTSSTSSSEQSSTMEDVSTDTSSAFFPKELQKQKTGGKSQGIGG